MPQTSVCSTVSLRFTSPSTGPANGRIWHSPALSPRQFEAENCKYTGSGEQVRDFTYVDDVVKANLLAATVTSALALS